MNLAWILQAASIKPIGTRFLGVLAFGVCHCVGGAAPLFAQPLDELAGTRLICETGPSAREARAERLVGAAHVTAANVLPNPSLVVEHERALSGATDTQTVVGVSVPLAIGGRRSLLQDAAAARREQAFSEADSTLFESALSFRQAYAGAVVDQARVSVLDQQQTVLDELNTTIAGLAKGGEAAEYDLLRQRVHARLHQRTLDSAKARANASLVLLEAWLGSKITLPPAALFNLAGGALGDDHPVDTAGAQHPNLRSLDAEARASAFEARAAHRRWFPDLEIFAGYRTTGVADDTGHGIALSLRVPLTFFDHGQGEAAKALAEQERALGTAESLRRQYGAHLQSLNARLDVLTVSAAAFDSATIDASTLQDKAKQLYAAGEATITELLEAFRAAEETRLGLIDLAEETALTRLSRMRAAGTQLDAGLDKACNATHGRPQ